ncbi:MAG: nucleotidyl transferase AbiEii/AbiGii toxin family protein [Candidatus Omnitrophica bacterium]|nr:nucleotidyl transferase AbiEii/AbiGii toxin family protein [Candidatus Omnitrophota bacterium]
MNDKISNLLQIREVFHLEFLRWFGRKIKPAWYALKGGVNLRFFFNSFRYSEDMDLDIHTVKVVILADVVMGILQSVSFQDSLRPFGIEKIIPPNITKAKQTQTTQRFKIHLITPANEDFFTKIEFLRRGFKGEVVVQTVSTPILRLYKSSPLVVPHYDAQSAIIQKIEALSTRVMVQARDIFDLYMLASYYKPLEKKQIKMDLVKFKKACENVFTVSFEQFRDTVISYLAADEQAVYAEASLWDEIKLKVCAFIEEIRKTHG